MSALVDHSLYESSRTSADRAAIGTPANINNSLVNIVGAHESYGFIQPVSGDALRRASFGMILSTEAAL